MVTRSQAVRDERSASARAATESAEVSIKSRPDGADISVDGKYVGSTPSVIRLAAGDHDVEILKTGFSSWKRKITVSSGSQVNLDATLDSADQVGHASLRIEARSEPPATTLRTIARAIEECPETIKSENKWGKGPLDVYRWYVLAPTNVVWDIAPNPAAFPHSPYVGSIEFTRQSRVRFPDEKISEKFRRTHDGLAYIYLLKILSTKQRYEFDIGPEGIKLTKALERSENATNWRDKATEDVCWDKLVRRAENPDKEK